METKKQMGKDMLIGDILEARPSSRHVMVRHFGEPLLNSKGIIWEKLSTAARLYNKDINQLIIDLYELED